MLTFTTPSKLAANDRVTLSYDDRKRSRLNVRLDSGREAAIFLDRGAHLTSGDTLLGDDGHTVLLICAADEALCQASCDQPLLLARAAYHLGNRHVPVQIITDTAGGRLRFQADPVLADMLAGLGCMIDEISAPFEPEAGAYHSHRPHGHSPADDDHDHHDHMTDPGHGAHRSRPKIHQFTAP